MLKNSCVLIERRGFVLEDFAQIKSSTEQMEHIVNVLFYASAHRNFHTAALQYHDHVGASRFAMPRSKARTFSDSY